MGMGGGSSGMGMGGGPPGGGLGRGLMNMSQGGGMGGGGGQDPTPQNVPPLGGKGGGGAGGLGYGGMPASAAMSGSNRFAANPMGGGGGTGGKGGAQDAPMSHQHATERARANTEAIKATHSIIKHLIQRSGQAQPADWTSEDVFGDEADLGRQVWGGPGIPGQGPW